MKYKENHLTQYQYIIERKKQFEDYITEKYKTVQRNIPRNN